MGRAHFEQMLNDAADLDCRALPLAMAMVGPTSQVEYELFGRGVWDTMPVDKRVELARKLLDLQSWFSHRLQCKLLDGEITVLGKNMRTGATVHIKDTDVIDCDDPVIPRSELPVALMFVN